jgi:putative protein kinase ArgK-like GTPase of G3E family
MKLSRVVQGAGKSTLVEALGCHLLAVRHHTYQRTQRSAM